MNCYYCQSFKYRSNFNNQKRYKVCIVLEQYKYTESNELQSGTLQYYFSNIFVKLKFISNYIIRLRLCVYMGLQTSSVSV